MGTVEVTAAYETLVDRFVLWAQDRDDIRAAVIIGSRARTDHPADEWSDLDLLFFCHDPGPYLSATAWLDNVGNSWLNFIEHTADGSGFERRVLFEGGLDVDFIPVPVADLEAMLAHGVPPSTADLIQRGTRIIIDKDGLARRLQEAKIVPPPYSPPAEAEFLNVVNDFWYHTVWSGKHLRRGELWWGKSCVDGYMKNLLRQMLEWHAQASQSPGLDTWLRGRFLEEWTDPRAVAQLPDVYARYDEDDIWRALFATMALFRWLALETAEHWGFSFPQAGEEKASAFTRKLYAGRTTEGNHDI